MRAGAKRMTLSEFLLARIAEEETAALAVDPWHWSIDQDGEVWPDVGALMRLFNPLRVLAECKAKRDIVEMLDDMPERADRWYACAYLAAVYADHANYDEEWRP